MQLVHKHATLIMIAFLNQPVITTLKQENKINKKCENMKRVTARKVSKYGVFSGPYFPLFSPNTGKYGSEKTPFLETFHAVVIRICFSNHYAKRM